MFLLKVWLILFFNFNLLSIDGLIKKSQRIDKRLFTLANDFDYDDYPFYYRKPRPYIVMKKHRKFRTNKVIMFHHSHLHHHLHRNFNNVST